VKRNVLLITLDQFRGDCFSTTRDTGVSTPGLHELARHGVHFDRHYSQASPCSPGRASLYTGMYQMNHRVVANGTPLDRSFDNLALAARRAGYAPALFGYTDQAVDPRDTVGAHDPRLQSYEGVLPGFDSVLDLTGDHAPWVEWLATQGVDVSVGFAALISTESERHESLSLSMFMTDQYFDWLDRQQPGWFCHLSYLRPHSPYSAAGSFANMYDPAQMPMPIAPEDDRHPLHEFALNYRVTQAPTDEEKLRRMKANYFGMISEVDSQLVRVWKRLRERDEWDDTLIILSSDHGEMLGDHGLKEKVGYWEQSYHIPCIVRDPGRAQRHGATVNAFTENVDIFPTLCELLGLPAPTQCDGHSLAPFLDDAPPKKWRTAATWEFDWSSYLLDRTSPTWSPELVQCSLVTRRTESHALVQLADGTALCFDLRADPTWRTQTSDPSVILDLSRELHAWRMQKNRHHFTGFLVDKGGIGRWPEGVAWRESRE
jgi:arylsulfatase A-like enzyme